jgi:hypothetical protein
VMDNREHAFSRRHSHLITSSGETLDSRSLVTIGKTSVTGYQ